MGSAHHKQAIGVVRQALLQDCIEEEQMLQGACDACDDTRVEWHEVLLLLRCLPIKRDDRRGLSVCASAM